MAFTDRRDTDRGIWDQIEGNWREFKGAIKEKWNRLTDDDIEEMQGSQEKIIGKIQQRYGETKYESSRIERELDELYRERYAGKYE